MTKPKTKAAIIRRLLKESKGKVSYVSVAGALEYRRDQYGLSRQEFAAIIGLTASHYSEIINGKRRLPLSATIRAYAIGVPAPVLLQPDAKEAGK